MAMDKSTGTAATAKRHGRRSPRPSARHGQRISDALDSTEPRARRQLRCALPRPEALPRRAPKWLRSAGPSPGESESHPRWQHRNGRCAVAGEARRRIRTRRRQPRARGARARRRRAPTITHVVVWVACQCGNDGCAPQVHGGTLAIPTREGANAQAGQDGLPAPHFRACRAAPILSVGSDLTYGHAEIGSLGAVETAPHAICANAFQV